MTPEKLDRIKGALVGLAVGDALGVHHEFKHRKYVVPITDYTEGNPYGIPIGYWTDDTSMALCMGQSLIEKGEYDPMDIMMKFRQWQRKGYMSSTETCFDIGNTTRSALMKFWTNPSGGPYCGSEDHISAGNGSIMRLAPIPLFFNNDIQKAIDFAGLSSKLTHGYIECVDACKLLSEIIWKAINEKDIFWLVDDFANLPGDVRVDSLQEFCPNIAMIAKGSFANKTEDEISGSGYVTASLEAALWAFYNSTSFEESVLKAVNLGDDADTTGAVTGQIAGARYGYNAIPQHWKDRLRHHDTIVEMAEKIAILQSIEEKNITNGN